MQTSVAPQMMQRALELQSAILKAIAHEIEKYEEKSPMPLSPEFTHSVLHQVGETLQGISLEQLQPPPPPEMAA